MAIKKEDNQLSNFRRPRKQATSGASKVVNKLKKDVKILKQNDVKNYKVKHQSPSSLSASITNVAPVIFCLNNMTQGTDETNRIGAKVKMIHLEMNLHLYRVSTLSNIPVLVRVMLVREITTLGSLLSLSQLMNSATPPPYDVRNNTTRDAKRFKVLSDKTFVMGPKVNSTASTFHYNGNGPMNKIIKWNKKLNFMTNYIRGNTGTVSDIDTNALHLIIFTDSTVASDLQADLAYNLIVDDN